jgi:hypothetical protein
MKPPPAIPLAEAPTVPDSVRLGVVLPRLVRRLRCAIIGHVVYPCDHSGVSLMRRTEAGIEAECDHCGKTIRATCGLELFGLVWCRKPNE